MATNNLSDLTKDLMSVYDELRANKIKPEAAKDLAKVANAAVNTARVVLDYNVWLNPKNNPNSTKEPNQLLS